MTRYTNAEMDAMITVLDPFLDRSDLIGYAAARNTRRLQDGAYEYLKRKQEIIQRLGEPVCDSDGSQIGYRIPDDKLGQANDEIREVAELSHDVELYLIPISQAMDKLSGREMLALDFIFEEADDGD